MNALHHPLLISARQSRSARGFSLFEILLSLALLALGMGAISQLMETGLQAALRNQRRTEGLFLCESKLAELIVSTTPPKSSGETSFPDSPDWKWSVATSNGPQADLIRLEVHAVHYAADQSTEDMRVTLVRLIRIPTTPPPETTSLSRPFGFSLPSHSILAARPRGAA